MQKIDLKIIIKNLAFIAMLTACVGFHGSPETKISHDTNGLEEFIMPSKEDRFFAEQELVVLRRVKFNNPIPKPEHVTVLDIQQVGFTSLNFLVQVLEKFQQPNLKYERLGMPRIQDRCPNFMQRGNKGGLFFRDPADQSLKKRNPSAYQQYSFVNGHIPWWPEYAELVQAKGITAVRNPLGINGRVVADANFAYSRGYIKNIEEAEQYIKDYVDNLQTRMIAGEDYMDGECSEETLQKAMENIDKHFLLCWTTDADMNKLVEILASIFDWGNIALPKRTQVSGEKIFVEDTDLSPELNEYITQANQYDLRLYEHVKVRMKAWIAENIQGYEEVDPDEMVRCFLANYAKDRVPYMVPKKDIDDWNANVGTALLETEQDWPDDYDEIKPEYKLPSLSLG